MAATDSPTAATSLLIHVAVQHSSARPSTGPRGFRTASHVTDLCHERECRTVT